MNSSLIVVLVEKSADIFTPEKVVFCKNIPLKDLPENKDKNVITNDFNKLLNDYIADKSFYKMLALNRMIEQSPQKNSIYHDNFHPNCQNGIPWLKNKIHRRSKTF